ncbi:MAG: BamA/TamA family outer membrane protein [Armatimonadetes bacterium]|nr:BamA/TamA family outer membrane protein [Armatimonadota bacterium]
MMNRVLRTRYMALVMAFSLLIAAIPSNLCAQDAAKVVEVVITGNVNINTETILNVVSLKAGDTYTEEAAEKDKAAIMSLGFFSVVTVLKENVAGGIKVTYEVTENPKISGVNITGSDPIPVKAITDLIKTQAGQVLNTNTVNADIERIQQYYGDRGYIGYVTEEIGVDSATGILNIPILVHIVESVEITGNKKTRSYVFLREMDTRAGTVFNKKTLGADLMRIYNLDILEDIKEYEVNAGSDIGLVKIVIPVVEKKTGNISLGFGYSSRQRLVGQFRMQESNFRGLGQNVNALWEQGTTNATGGSASYELGFFEPWIDKKHTSLSVSGFNKLVYRFSSGIFGTGGTFANDTFYSERHIGGDLTLSRPLSTKTRAYVGFRFENVDANPGLLKGGLIPGSQPNAYYVSNLVNIVQKGSIATGSLRFVIDTRDIGIDPAVGGYDALSLEIGTVDATQYTDQGVPPPPAPQNPIALPFKGQYEKASIDVRRYFSRMGRKTSPTDKRTTIAMRLRAGYGSGKLPYFEQFFVGGSESLRGYREDRFWGDKMLLTSVEFRQPIAPSLTGVAFVDYGGAWGSASNFNIPELPQSQKFNGSFGTGIGIRVTTPIGNLRLDYAVGSEGARTHFSMGHAF